MLRSRDGSRRPLEVAAPVGDLTYLPHVPHSMAKGKSANPADAFRKSYSKAISRMHSDCDTGKAQRKKELKKAKTLASRPLILKLMAGGI